MLPTLKIHRLSHGFIVICSQFHSRACAVAPFPLLCVRAFLWAPPAQEHTSLMSLVVDVVEGNEKFFLNNFSGIGLKNI